MLKERRKMKGKRERKIEKYCQICGKMIGEQGKLYIAGSLCEGHTIWEVLLYKIFKFYYDQKD